LSYVSIFQTADYPLSPRVCARKQQRGEMEGRGDAGMLALIGLLCHTHRALLTVTRMPEGRVLQVARSVLQVPCSSTRPTCKRARHAIGHDNSKQDRG